MTSATTVTKQSQMFARSHLKDSEKNLFYFQSMVFSMVFLDDFHSAVEIPGRLASSKPLPPVWMTCRDGTTVQKFGESISTYQFGHTKGRRKQRLNLYFIT